MSYLPELNKKTLKDCKRLELESYAKHKIIINGDEKTQEEVIYNNIINYLNKNNVPIDKQIKYLKYYNLYLYDEENKNKGTNFMFKGLTTAGFMTCMYSFGSNNNKLACASAGITAFLIVIHSLINKYKPNIYMENDVMSNDENDFFEDILLEDKMIRESIKYNEHVKALIK